VAEHAHTGCNTGRAMRRSFFLLAFPLLLLAPACQEGGRSSKTTARGPEADSEASGNGGAGKGSNRGGSALEDSAPADPAPSGPPRIDFVGRFNMTDANAPICGWPGCRIVARFEGTRVSARMQEITESWMSGGPSEWDVAIDGQLQSKLVMAAGTKDYELATGLNPGVHVVELYKRNEGQTGATQFHGYDFGDGKLLPPPGRHVRKIEIIGDSAAAGFGVEGVGQTQESMCPGLQYAAKWQNFRKSFGARLGQALKAEVNGTVYSGKGMVKNIWRPDKQTMPLLFPLAVPTDEHTPWDFAAYLPDVVVVMIGGNDFAIGQPQDDGAPSLAQFTSTYDGFIVTVRQKYPDAHVFLATSPSVSDAEPPNRGSRTNVKDGVDGVVARRNGAGDARVYAVTPTVATKEELTGCEGHGSPEFHQRVANELVPIIRGKTGW
jgi:Carbohydrate esterase 2 N-terminal/GDSL-like Lipase/Acylhydrolase family